jgi:hypothetical protein
MQLLEQARRDPVGLRGAAQIAAQHDELVAAEAGDRISRTQEAV